MPHLHHVVVMGNSNFKISFAIPTPPTPLFFDETMRVWFANPFEVIPVIPKIGKMSNSDGNCRNIKISNKCFR